MDYLLNAKREPIKYAKSEAYEVLNLIINGLPSKPTAKTQI